MRPWGRSGAIALAALCVLGAGIGCRGKAHQALHRLRHGADVPSLPADPQPGGRDAIVLRRYSDMTSNVPEFISSTLMPGRGFQMLDLKAHLPTLGDIPLLQAPTLEEATKAITGTGPDQNGAASLGFGAVFEAPWAGLWTGTPSANGSRVISVWHGMAMDLPWIPTDTRNGRLGVTQGGSLLTTYADAPEANVMPDGGQGQATFVIPSNQWPSEITVSTEVLMSAHTMDVTIVARNTGSNDAPISLGWCPRFAILPGHRATTTLKLPQSQRVVRDKNSGLPNGSLEAVSGSAQDFTVRGGRALGLAGIDDDFVNLRPALLDDGAIVELRDKTAKYGLRITALTSLIRSFHVSSPAGASYIIIEPKFTFDDPTGREWGQDQDTGLETLAPGRSVQYKLRIDIISTDAPPASSF
jgi:aldose 1-epimerase